MMTNDFGVPLTETFKGQYAVIPEHIQNGLVAYVNNRYLPGMFLEKVLCKDLGAVVYADEESLKSLKEIFLWLYNNAPASCWGSPILFNNWLRERE